MRLAPLTRMEHLSEKEWFPMATLPIEKALAYLDALEADRRAALALSEQKAEEASLIKARQEGFKAAMEMLGTAISAGAISAGAISAGDAASDPKEPRRRRVRRDIRQLIL